jgi:hypothetical protein
MRERRSRSRPALTLRHVNAQIGLTAQPGGGIRHQEDHP